MNDELTCELLTFHSTVSQRLSTGSDRNPQEFQNTFFIYSKLICQ
jgi:hypothetical protein